jgi:hypothetical protein
VVPGGDLGEAVATSVDGGDDPRALRVTHWQADLEQDQPTRRIIVGNESRSDHLVLARVDPPEVDERNLEFAGGPESPVVGLVG